MGYDVELEFSSGVWEDGEKYDAIQKNIVNNHLAIVERGRAGKEVRIRLDGESAIQIDETDLKEDLMKVKVGDKEYEMSEEAGKAVMDMMKAHDEMMGKMKKKKDEDDAALETLKSEKTQLEAKCDSLDADLKKAQETKKEEKMDSKEVSRLVRARRRIDKVAEKILDEETLKKIDSMDDIEVQKAVLKAEFKEINLDGKSDEYVAARFDHVADKLEVSAKENEKISNKDQKDQKEDDNKDKKMDAEEIRANNMKKDQEAWKQPVGKSIS